LARRDTRAHPHADARSIAEAVVKLVSMVLLCVASNVDNLTAGITLGLRSFEILFRQNAMIAVVTVAGTYASITAGSLMADFAARTAANAIGAVVVMAIGAWTIAHGWTEATVHAYEAASPAEPTATSSTPMIAVTGVVAHLSFRATVALAAALAINNVVTGVGAGAAGLSPMWTALVSGLVSLVFVAMGNRLAWTLSGVLSARRSAMLAGGLLLVLGVYELVV
jgi:putative sporulation protein YtaF